MRDRMAVAAGLAVAAIVVGTGMALAARPSDDAPPRPSHVELAISGEVDGLYPGGGVALDVTLTNPYRFDLRVRSLEVDVSDASPACPASVLVVGPVPSGQRIPGRGATAVDVPIAMLDTAPDACQGATFALSYTATATKPR